MTLMFSTLVRENLNTLMEYLNVFTVKIFV